MPASPAAPSHIAPRSTSGPGARFLAAAWAVLVIGFYYRRVPTLLADGPGSWGLRDALPALVLLVLGVASVAVWSTWQRRRRGARAKLLARGLFAVTALGAAVALAGVETHVPSAGEAARRTVMSLFGAGLVVFDAFVLGQLVLEALGFRSAVASERNVFVFAMGFAAISYASLLTAAAGVYRPHVVAGLLSAIGVVGLARVAARARRAGFRWRHDRRSRVGLASSDRLWIGVCAAAVVIAFVAALAPETEYDALWYHLWLPLLWLQHGAPTDAPTEFVALYPLTWELVFGAGLAAGGQLAAKLLHFICLPLCGLAVWQFARRFLPGADPWLSVAVFLTVPTVLWEATTAYVDLALAFYVTAGLYALMAYLEQGHAASTGISQSVPRNRWLAVAAICLGTATAIKHLGLIVLALLVAGLVVHVAVRRRVMRSLFPAVAILAAAILMAAPWYLRAWQATGNPFFPELYKIFGAPPSRWDPAAEQGLNGFKARFGVPRTPLNLVALPWNVTMHGALFGGCTGVVLLLALPAVIASRRRASPGGRDVARWLGLVTFGYVGAWASPISSQQLRFLLPVMPLLALLCGDGLTSVLRRVTARRLRSIATAFLFALLVLNLPPFTPLHEGDREGWTGWMTHVVRKVPVGVVVGREPADLYLRRHVPTYGAWQHVRVHLPASAKVLELGGGDNFYATRERVPMDARAAQGAWASGSGAELAVRATLDTLGVSHVMFDRRQLQDLERSGAAIASHNFRARELALEYEDSGALLYRVERRATAGGPRAPGAS